MPLPKSPETEWDGWLVDGLGEREEQHQQILVEALKSRDIPKGEVRTGTVNMWWRKDSRYIDVLSKLDGTIVITIHIQQYGSSLWIGRAAVSYSQSNYYKRMAASAFLETVDRCVRETTLTMVDETAMHEVSDVDRK